MPEVATPINVPALDITKYLGQTRNRISKIGLELEGGWKKWPKGERQERDGSVFHDLGRNKALQEKITALGVTRHGELPSDPMLPGRMRVWMKKNYPDLVNDTCGLHVHMSFDNLRYYDRLMIPEFPMTMLAYLKEWAHNEQLPENHPIWNRLADGNTYCRNLFWPDAQVKATRKEYTHERGGNRYTVINYCHGLHKTMECRVLPMFDDVQLGIRAVQKVLDITNASIATLVVRDKKVSVKVPGPPPGGRVERNVEVLDPTF